MNDQECYTQTVEDTNWLREQLGEIRDQMDVVQTMHDFDDWQTSFERVVRNYCDLVGINR